MTVSLSVTLLMVSVALPVLVSVAVWLALICPTVKLLKGIVETESVSAGVLEGALPVEAVPPAPQPVNRSPKRKHPAHNACLCMHDP